MEGNVEGRLLETKLDEEEIIISKERKVYTTAEKYLNEQGMNDILNDDDISKIESLDKLYDEMTKNKGEVNEETLNIQTKQGLSRYIENIKKYMRPTGMIIILFFSAIAGVGVIVGTSTGIYKLVKAASVDAYNNKKSKIYYYINK
jgi:hypothetical protein